MLMLHASTADLPCWREALSIRECHFCKCADYTPGLCLGHVGARSHQDRVRVTLRVTFRFLFVKRVYKQLVGCCIQVTPAHQLMVHRGPRQNKDAK